MSHERKRIEQGIRVRHERGCRAHGGGRCSCTPSFQARAWSAAEGREVTRTFRDRAEARRWRARAVAGQADVIAGAQRAPVIDAVADDVWEKMASGALRNRSGDVYKPSVIRSYRKTYDLYVSDAVGRRRVTSLTRRDVQAIVDELVARGLSPSTVRNALMPLRLIYRVAIRDEMGVVASPIKGVEVPAVRGRRDRLATPVEIGALLEALPPEDQAVWATAFYAGLRRGELMALTVQSVDLKDGVIRVLQSYDPGSRTFTGPKSRAGVRTVPIVRALREHLAAHMLRTRRRDGLLFAREDGTPFRAESLTKRATRLWTARGLERITLHECRHTFASLMIAAGVNAKTLQEIGGWSSIAIVFDRYGHLMPGARDEAAQLLDSYLDQHAVKRHT